MHGWFYQFFVFYRGSTWTGLRMKANVNLSSIQCTFLVFTHSFAWLEHWKYTTHHQQKGIFFHPTLLQFLLLTLDYFAIGEDGIRFTQRRHSVIGAKRRNHPISSWWSWKKEQDVDDDVGTEFPIFHWFSVQIRSSSSLFPWLFIFCAFFFSQPSLMMMMILPMPGSKRSSTTANVTSMCNTIMIQ